MGTAKILALTWRICIRERDLHKYGKEPIRVLHVLGTISGTSLWLEEIVNRFFFSTINSFVYIGAAILLVTIGLRRIYDVVPDWIVISSICLEAFLLSIMFFIMYFSPIDEDSVDEQAEKEQSRELRDLIREVGEISRDYASVAVRLEQITDALHDMGIRQEALISTTKDAVLIASQAVSPNSELLQSMQDTSHQLRLFSNVVSQLNISTEALRREEIEFAVRRELEKIIADTVTSGYVKKTEHKRRRVSEIYFVLYLAALIMLLPGKNEKKGDSPLDQIIAVFQQSFSLLQKKYLAL